MALRLAVSADPTKIASLSTTEELKDPVVAGPPDIDDGGDGRAAGGRVSLRDDEHGHAGRMHV